MRFPLFSQPFISDVSFGSSVWHSVHGCIFHCLADIHDENFVHTDLKPENILLQRDQCCAAKEPGKQQLPQTTAIQLIDLGSVAYNDKRHTSIVSTRHYRAPEVILGTGWWTPCDIWSVACIMVELVTGRTLFQTHEDAEHLAMMEKCLGSLPTSLTQQMKPKHRLASCFQDGRLDWPHVASSRASVAAVEGMRSLKQMLSSAVEREEHVQVLSDLLEGMLALDPVSRLQASQALNHPFFQARLTPFSKVGTIETIQWCLLICRRSYLGTPGRRVDRKLSLFTFWVTKRRKLIH